MAFYFFVFVNCQTVPPEYEVDLRRISIHIYYIYIAWQSQEVSEKSRQKNPVNPPSRRKKRHTGCLRSKKTHRPCGKIRIPGKALPARASALSVHKTVVSDLLFIDSHDFYDNLSSVPRFYSWYSWKIRARGQRFPPRRPPRTNPHARAPQKAPFRRTRPRRDIRKTEESCPGGHATPHARTAQKTAVRRPRQISGRREFPPAPRKPPPAKTPSAPSGPDFGTALFHPPEN